MSMLKKIFESFCLQRQDFTTGVIPPSRELGGAR
jgi:hypothetical protein